MLTLITEETQIKAVMTMARVKEAVIQTLITEGTQIWAAMTMAGATEAVM